MKRIPCRVAIYARDIENILGKNTRTAYRILHQIRKHHNKKSNQPVTITEFCTYLNMEEELVSKFLG